MIVSDEVKKLICKALAEDVGVGDVTSQVLLGSEVVASAEIRAKQDLVLAGIEVCREVFLMFDPSLQFEMHFGDGQDVGRGDTIASVRGRARSLLGAERTALNFLQRLSGIATHTRRFVDAAGVGVKVLDTRKTLPGWRVLEKYAVRMGGGVNHRMGLFDRYLIKDNHIALVGSVYQAVKKAKRERKEVDALIEVEVHTVEEVEEAVRAGADVIMLDNMEQSMVAEVVKLYAGRAKFEVSGGITLDNIRQYAETGVDYISVGAITHSASAVDIHMVIIE